jgi:flagellin
MVSSGLRVGEAKDNAAYWSIATTMRSDNMSLSAVQDALGLGAAMVDTTYAGMSAAVDLVSEFKARLVAATEQGVDKSKVNEELSQLKEQMRSVAYSASFNGQNWLTLTDDNWQGFLEPRTIPGYVIRDGDSFRVGSVTVFDKMEAPWGPEQMYPLVDDTSGADTGKMGVLTNPTYADQLGTATNWVILHTLGNPDPALGTEIVLDANTTAADLDEMIDVTETMLQETIRWSSRLGSTQMRLAMQEDFVSKLASSIDKGIGRLVDADMNEASTRLKAIQTQQQLAIQSLSIANTNAENVMQLFR